MKRISQISFDMLTLFHFVHYKYAQFNYLTLFWPTSVEWWRNGNFRILNQPSPLRTFWTWTPLSLTRMCRLNREWQYDSNSTYISFFFSFKQDQRHFLLPWIAVMVADILIEFIHFIYMIITDAVRNNGSVKQSDAINWKIFLNSVSAVLRSDRRDDVYYWLFPRVYQCNYSIQLYITSIVSAGNKCVYSQVYCLLCVVSQYQEYKAGRGYARSQNNVATRVSTSRTSTISLAVYLSARLDWF